MADERPSLSPDGNYAWDARRGQWTPVPGPPASPSPGPVRRGERWGAAPRFSMKIKEGKRPAILAKSLGPGLRPGERVLFVSTCNQFKPLTSYLVVTDRRVLTADSARIVTDFPFDEPLRVAPEPGKERLEVEGAAARRIVFKGVSRDEQSAFMSSLSWARERFANQPAAVGGPSASAPDAAGETAGQVTSAVSAGRARPEEGIWPRTEVVGARLSKKASLAVGRQAHGDEPWLILVSAGGAGLLTAFADRMAIVKTGLLTSAMAGSFGGERAATFYFRDVNGLEYNSGIVNGALEVLTASYNGTANRDHWRGTGSGSNSDSNDPYKLSNTLPLAKAEYNSALPQLNELRRRIAASKNPTVQVSVPLVEQARPTPGAPSLVEELTKLGELRTQGILSDEEFARAKARLLG